MKKYLNFNELEVGNYYKEKTYGLVKITLLHDDLGNGKLVSIQQEKSDYSEKHPFYALDFTRVEKEPTAEPTEAIKALTRMFSRVLVNDIEEYVHHKNDRDIIKQALEQGSKLEKLVTDLLSTNVYVILGRQCGKTHQRNKMYELINEIKTLLGLE